MFLIDSAVRTGNVDFSMTILSVVDTLAICLAQCVALARATAQLRSDRRTTTGLGQGGLGLDFHFVFRIFSFGFQLYIAMYAAPVIMW